MSEFLTWLAVSGERITVTSLLLIALFVVVYGLRKKWWVPGYLYTDCQGEVAKLELKVQEYIDRTQKRLDILEELEEQRPSPPKRRT